MCAVASDTGGIIDMFIDTDMFIDSDMFIASLCNVHTEMNITRAVRTSRHKGPGYDTSLIRLEGRCR